MLTAAHCASIATSIRVLLGAHNVREETEEGRLEMITTDFFSHEVVYHDLSVSFTRVSCH